MNHDVIGSSVKKFHWRYGILASLAITFLSIFPQIDLWRLPESARPGPYATLEFDEVAYSAYLNALISGRSRRNDPYLDLIDTPASPQPETLFSVQFLPPYMLALPARLLRLSAATMFILLGPLAAFASGIALFWLLGSITQDDRAAAAGLLLVLCFGSLVGTPLALRMIARFQNPFPVLSFLPFLRRYVPAVPFPFYLLFCGLIWRALTKQTVRAAAWPAIGAGLVFAMLV